MYASQRPTVAGTPSFEVLPAGTDPTHVARQEIAHDTLTAMAEGLYIVHDVHYDLTQRIKSMVEGVRVYGADATLEPPAWGKGSQHTHSRYLTRLHSVRCAGEIAKLAGKGATPRTERNLSTHALVYTPTRARGCAINHLDLRRRLESGPHNHDGAAEVRLSHARAPQRSHARSPRIRSGKVPL